MKSEIRLAMPSDAEQVGYVHHTAWIETYTGKIDANFLATRNAEKSSRMFARTGCKDTYVLEVDGKIVGFAGFGRARDQDLDENSGEIQGIYLLRQFQGLGLGKRLLQTAMDALRQQGMAKVYLWVLDTNSQAIGFYTKAGFHFDGTSKVEVLVKPITEHRYVRELE